MLAGSWPWRVVRLEALGGPVLAGKYSARSTGAGVRCPGRPVARAGGHGPLAPGYRAVTDQLVLTAVSSTTNEVWSETSSVPVNLRVTVLPAKLDSEYVCWV